VTQTKKAHPVVNALSVMSAGWPIAVDQVEFATDVFGKQADLQLIYDRLTRIAIRTSPLSWAVS